MVVKQFNTGGVTVRIHDDRCKPAEKVNMTAINRIVSSSHAARAGRPLSRIPIIWKLSQIDGRLGACL